MIAWHVVMEIGDGVPVTEFAADVKAATRDEAIRLARSAYSGDLVAPFLITDISACPVPVQEPM